MSIKYIRQALFLPQIKDEKNKQTKQNQGLEWLSSLPKAAQVQLRVEPRSRPRHSANRAHLLKNSTTLPGLLAFQPSGAGLG